MVSKRCDSSGPPFNAGLGGSLGRRWAVSHRERAGSHGEELRAIWSKDSEGVCFAPGSGMRATRVHRPLISLPRSFESVGLDAQRHGSRELLRNLHHARGAVHQYE